MKKKLVKRVVGLDYGTSRIGLAISDERGIIALPLEKIKSGKTIEESVENVLRTLKGIEDEYVCEIDILVVGFPLLMNGKPGQQADHVREFSKCLFERSGKETKLFDERLTTAQVEKSLKSLDLNRKNRTKVVDSASASVILQTYLDTLINF